MAEEDVKISGFDVTQTLSSCSYSHLAKVEPNTDSSRLAKAYAPAHSKDAHLLVRAFSEELCQLKAFREHLFTKLQSLHDKSHPHIITPAGIEEENHQFFIFYNELNCLTAQLDKPYSKKRALTFIKSITSALCCAYDEDVVHGNIHPNNIFCYDDGSIALSDFGISRTVQEYLPHCFAKQIAAHAAYVSPEIIQKKLSTSQSDIYSLGILLYRLLTGSLPFSGKHSHSILAAHVNSPCPPLPPELQLFQALLDKMVAKTPEDRFQSPYLLLEAILEFEHQFSSGSPIQSTQASLANTTANISPGYEENEASREGRKIEGREKSTASRQRLVKTGFNKKTVILGSSAAALAGAMLSFVMFQPNNHPTPKTIENKPIQAATSSQTNKLPTSDPAKHLASSSTPSTSAGSQTHQPQESFKTDRPLSQGSSPTSNPTPTNLSQPSQPSQPSQHTTPAKKNTNKESTTTSEKAIADLSQPHKVPLKQEDTPPPNPEPPTKAKTAEEIQKEQARLAAAEAKKARSKALATLTQQAEIYWKRSHFFHPPGKNVIETYHKIIELDQNSSTVKLGKQRMVKRFKQEALKMAERKEWSAAIQHIESAQAYLSDTALEIARQSIQQKWNHHKKNQQKISQLLTRAEQQATLGNRFSPENDNAILTLQAILQIDPTHSKALQKIKVITYSQQQQSETLYHQGRLKDSLNAVTAALNVFPNNSDLRQLHAKVDQAYQQQAHDFKTAMGLADRYKQQKQYTTPISTNAYTVYNDFLRKYPNHEVATTKRNQLLSELVNEANRQFEINNLQLSMQLAKQILFIESNSQEAIQLIGKIQRYNAINQCQSIDDRFDPTCL